MRYTAPLKALALVSLVVCAASARDLGQWTQVEPEIRAWFGQVVQPDTGQSCCGESDAYWADSFEVDAQGRTIAIITDTREIKYRVPIPVGTRIIIPNNKLDTRRQGNPTGHGIVFVAPTLKDNVVQPDSHVYCYFPPGGV